jgi:hypothetical protein
MMSLRVGCGPPSVTPRARLPVANHSDKVSATASVKTPTDSCCPERVNPLDSPYKDVDYRKRLSEISWNLEWRSLLRRPRFTGHWLVNAAIKPTARLTERLAGLAGAAVAVAFE